MKITCQSCQAKYTIADEKVLGKIVKIRCKKCSSTIVVNGSDASRAPSYGAAEGDVAAQDDAWTVNVADGDQRTMTEGEIVAAFQAGVIGTETFCWKDGMGDWLPLREIDALYDACNATRAIPSADEGSARMGRAAPTPEYAAASTNNGASNGGAARRAGGRGQGADLFHGAAQAGGEEEVMTSAPVAGSAPQAYDEQKPTGARNENSVLFSLSALTSKGTDRPPPVPGVEASGLIDIRQLSAQMGRGYDKKRSRVDDIMNLSSGGAFNGALSAPMLAPPAVDQYAPAAGEAAAGGAAPSKSKAMIFLALGAGAFVIVAAIGATMVMMKGKSDTDSAAASASAAGALAAAAPTATAPAATATAAATAAPTATAAAPEATAAATDTAAPPTAATTAAATATAAPVAAAPAAAPVAAAPAAPRPQAVAAAAPAAPKPAPAPAPAPAADEGGPAFNMGEAKSKLAAAAAAAQSCKKGDISGTGRVVVVFAPSGGAQTATISGPPFDGTPTGACVAARFRGVHVPPFSGSPFSVSKSFTIN
jgi:predicted Zn finger-like uncharacterized protein